MGTPDRRRRIQRWPWATTIRVTAGIWLLAGAAVAIGTTPSWTAVGANATLFVVILWLSTWAHEAGHALTARALGIRVARVTIGFGPSVHTFRFFGIGWRLGSFPYGGATFTAPTDGRGLRLRLSLVVMAGPIVTAALAAVGGMLAAGDAAHELAPARMLQASNVVLLVLSLAPIRFPGSVPASDGMLLMLIWRMPQLAVSELRAAQYHDAVSSALKQGLVGRATADCAAALGELPDNVALLNLDALIDIRAGRFQCARGKLLRLLERSDLDTQLRPLLQNNLAWTAVMLDDPDMLREAEEVSRDIVKRLPTPNTHGTRGAVLVLQNKSRRALRHLRRAYELHDEDSDSAHAAAWLAAAEAARGHFADAADWLATAEALDPGCQSLPRAGRLVKRRRRRFERLRDRMGKKGSDRGQGDSRAALARL